MAEKPEAIDNRPLPDEEIGGTEAELLRTARERYQKAIDEDRENREKAIEDLHFLAGEQWPSNLILDRKDDGRPTLTINRMPQFVRQVTGDIRQNRPSVKVRPVDDKSDDEIADIYSGLIRNIEYVSDALIAYQTAAEGSAQCGLGHYRIVTAYSNDDTFEQDIRIKRMKNHFSVVWEPGAVETDKSDARYCFVEEELDLETFKARYPDANTDGFPFQQASSEINYLGDWITRETVRVAEYWTVEKEERELGLLDDGRTVDMSDMEEEDGVLLDAETGAPITVTETRKVWRNKIEMRIINGAEVLEGPFDWPGQYIPIIPVMGEEIHIERKTIRHGVIRHAKDAQRMYNYWRSAQTEKIALEPKVPWLVTPAMIKGLQDVWQKANTRNLPYLPFTPDPSAPNMKPERNAPQMGSSSMAQEVLVAAEDMKATTGIYDASLGARSNETSGRAIRERKQESDTSTVAYSDNLSRAIRYGGRILLDLIPKIYDTERVVRLMNEDETTTTVTINQTVVDDAGNEHVINDLALGKYDVVVSTGPSFATKRQESADWMVELMRSMPQLGEQIADIVFKNLDLPGADEIAERLRKMLPPGLVEPRDGEEKPQPAPPTPDQMAKQAEMQIKGAEAKRKDAEAMADIEKTRAETEALQLENAEKALQLAMQNGQMQQFIAQQVEIMMREMFANGAGPGAQ